MEFTKERKILAAVVGIGAFALAFDRVVLGSGQTDPADAAAAAALVPAEASADLTTLVSTETPKEAAVVVPTTQETVASRLARYASQRGVDPLRTREAFVPGGAWGAPDASTPAAPETWSGTVDPVEVLRQFAAEHRLNAVMGGQDPGTAIAIVDGMPVRVGERVGAFSLQEVRERSAVFAGEAGRVELRLVSER